ncbi:hypothetical protein OEZ85_011456 [Tetradesmus obliquus]|uniref:Uncharacterized protein n=1 Tax=Tetradesmus obliquus TaxID=3088 RepID=A0ABY8TSH3_TETOB|nr:hypothetical protein OEZ85_011456 [Tetradesmus obliquus]
MAGAGRLRAQWNEALLQLVVAPAYLDLLAAAAQLLGHGTQYARLWPSTDAPEPWQKIVRQLYGHTPNKRLLWTAAHGGSWLAIDQCIFPDAACLQQQPFHLLTAGEAQQGWLQHAPQQNASSESSSSSSSSSSDGLGPLGQALLLLDMPLLDVPAGVLLMMQKHLPELPQSCTPAAARTAAAAHPDRMTILQRDTQLVPLLAYCLADVDLSAGAAACQQLLRLRLLPLADGSVAEVAEYSGGKSKAQNQQQQQQQQQQQLVFVVTEELELLLMGSQKHVLLDHELLGPALTAKLSLAASYGCLNLQLLSVQHLASSLLPQLLPHAWQHAKAVAWESAAAAAAAAGDAEGAAGDGSTQAAALSSGTGGALVTWEWLQGLWQWLKSLQQAVPAASARRGLEQGQERQQAQQEAVQQGTVALSPGCCLAPAGVYTLALDSRFLQASSEQEAAVMARHLGVAAPSAAAVYRDVLLPQLHLLPEAVRDAALLRMLRCLAELQQQDRGFMQLLAQTPFVPNSLGQLHTPSKLYDPRVPELVALLDPEACFPAAAFCSATNTANTANTAETSARDSIESAAAGVNGGGYGVEDEGNDGFSSLAALQQLGLRGRADLGTLLLAARYVEKTAREGNGDMAVARGKVNLIIDNCKGGRWGHGGGARQGAPLK